MLVYSLTLNYTVCNGTVRVNWVVKPLREPTKKALLRLFSRRRRARHWQRRK